MVNEIAMVVYCKDVFWKKGEQYANELILHIHQANKVAMRSLTEEQQGTLLSLMDTYVSAFRKEMLGK